jgi:hypothetical protein
VSYDIYFVRRDPGQSFEDALDATEESFEGDPGPLSPVELELWDELLPVARAVLGDAEEFRDEMTRELTDPATGIQMSLFNGEMAIHVPVAARDETGGAVMVKVRRLAKEIERVTGLEGYDPQSGEPVSDPSGGIVSAARRDQPDWDDDEDNESDGTSRTLPSSRPRHKEPATAGDSDESGRKRWGFWNR